MAKFGIAVTKVNHLSYIAAVLVLTIAMLACGGRVFTERQIYSSNPGAAEELYNPATDEILVGDVWVFRPDGTFDAVVNLDDEQLYLSGSYEGDNAGEGFYFFLDLAGSGQSDEEVFLSDDNSYIEWKHEGQTLRYTLAE
jgi:hypothetical protein